MYEPVNGIYELPRPHDRPPRPPAHARLAVDDRLYLPWATARSAPTFRAIVTLHLRCATCPIRSSPPWRPWNVTRTMAWSTVDSQQQRIIVLNKQGQYVRQYDRPGVIQPRRSTGGIRLQTRSIDRRERGRRTTPEFQHSGDTVARGKHRGRSKTAEHARDFADLVALPLRRSTEPQGSPDRLKRQLRNGASWRRALGRSRIHPPDAGLPGDILPERVEPVKMALTVVGNVQSFEFQIGTLGAFKFELPQVICSMQDPTSWLTLLHAAVNEALASLGFQRSNGASCPPHARPRPAQHKPRRVTRRWRSHRGVPVGARKRCRNRTHLLSERAQAHRPRTTGDVQVRRCKVSGLGGTHRDLHVVRICA